MERKSSYADFSSQLNEKNIVILEFGRLYTKCGFAGEPAPRAIIKTGYSGPDWEKIDLFTIYDQQKLEKLLGDFVERIYFNYLAVSPKEKKVVIVESVFCTSVFRNTLTRVLFERFTVPSILFVPDHLMALATLGRSTGLVVDLGSEEVITIAVVEGVTLLDGSQTASLGAKALDSLILKELIKNNPRMEPHLSSNVVEDIRLKTCFVCNYDRGLKITQDKVKNSKLIANGLRTENDVSPLGQLDDDSPQTLDYSLTGHEIIKIPGNLREGACEIMFEQFAHEQSLPTMIIETITASPIDCRRQLAENIIVIGGLANLPGLEDRLLTELKNIRSYKKSEITPRQFKFHKSVCPKNYVSWLGASLFCTSVAVEIRTTTRESWIRDGKKNLKDWSDLIE